MKREDLTPRQREVVECRDAVLLVTGGPGTGKTASALWAGHDAIVTGELAENQYVLYLTFSRSAVSQISKRAPQVLADARGRIEVATFHGLAFRLLRGFGRYVGMGASLPRLQSSAQDKLFGQQEGMIRYDDLVPAALRLLAVPWIGELARRRWPLVICDEAQDTGDDQWLLLKELQKGARLMLLADLDQMIHDWREDVSSERLEQARALATREIQLEPESHRDRSGVVPELARAVLARDFGNQAVTDAVASDALSVIHDVAGKDVADVVLQEVRRLRKAGCKTVGVFGFTNDGSAILSEQLSERGLGNTIVGISEAHGEAIAAMGVMLAHAVDQAEFEDLKEALAVFMAAFTRNKAALALPQSLTRTGDTPPALEELLRDLSVRLKLTAASGSLGDLLQVVRQSWASVFTGRTGQRLWLRAFGTVIGFADAIMDEKPSPGRLGALLERIEHARIASLASELEDAQAIPIHLMNFHQTKGREADGVVLVFRGDDFYARSQEGEPYEARSRLLYVAVSRARQKVTVILPPNPHPLISPFYASA